MVFLLPHSGHLGGIGRILHNAWKRCPQFLQTNIFSSSGTGGWNPEGLNLRDRFMLFYNPLLMIVFGFKIIGEHQELHGWYHIASEI
jgi:hypothetical protein